MRVSKGVRRWRFKISDFRRGEKRLVVGVGWLDDGYVLGYRGWVKTAFDLGEKRETRHFVLGRVMIPPRKLQMQP